MNWTEFRVQKIKKRKSNTTYVKCKGYDNSFNSRQNFMYYEYVKKHPV